MIESAAMRRGAKVGQTTPWLGGSGVTLPAFNSHAHRALVNGLGFYALVFSSVKWVSESIWAVITKHHRLSGLYNNDIYFLALEAGSLRSGCQHDQGLVKTLFGVADRWLLLVSSHGRKRERALWCPFHKGTNSTLYPHDLINSPRPYLLKTITLGVRI